MTLNHVNKSTAHNNVITDKMKCIPMYINNRIALSMLNGYTNLYLGRGNQFVYLNRNFTNLFFHKLTI